MLGYIEARKQIYIPTYRWVLENKVTPIIERMREASKTKTIVLLDYDTNADVEIAPALLDQYVITGKSGEAKKISLPRDLVDWE